MMATSFWQEAPSSHAHEFVRIGLQPDFKRVRPVSTFVRAKLLPDVYPWYSMSAAT